MNHSLRALEKATDIEDEGLVFPAGFGYTHTCIDLEDGQYDRRTPHLESAHTIRAF